MKYLLSFLLICSLAATGQKTYYLQPTGSDVNAGTLTAPFKTLQKAWTVVAPGDTIYLRGGTYAINTQQGLTGKNGTAAATIKVWAYPGERPAITLAAGSDLINTGLNVGLPFNGTAPDRGAIESGGQVIIVPPPPTPNAAPVANAGPDQTITLPTSTVTLNGSGTDIDGTIVKYEWSNAIGTKWPGQTVTMTGLIAGTYTYNLTVTDDKGATGTDQVTVTVLPAPPAPKTVLVNVWVYSDKTVSTATRQNLNKTMVCRIAVYTDGTIEKIK